MDSENTIIDFSFTIMGKLSNGVPVKLELSDLLDYEKLSAEEAASSIGAVLDVFRHENGYED